MFRNVLLLFVMFSTLAFSAHAQDKKHKINFKKEGYTKAVVINYNVDGCGFLLQLTDEQKTKLMPEKLPDDFKKDKKKVWIKYALLKKQPITTCMAGKMIELFDIEKR